MQEKAQGRAETQREAPGGTHFVTLKNPMRGLPAGRFQAEVKIGYKWVHIKALGKKRGVKIARSAWDNLSTEEITNGSV